MLGLLAVMAMVPRQAEQDWTHMWSMQTPIGTFALGLNVVGRTVLYDGKVLYLDTGRLEKLTMPEAYADSGRWIHMDYSPRYIDFEGKKLILISQGKTSKLAYSLRRNESEPWLYQISNEGKLIGTLNPMSGDQLGDIHSARVSWGKGTMTIYNAQEQMSGRENQRCFLLNPIRRPKLGFGRYSDFSNPERGVLACGKEIQNHSGDKYIGDVWYGAPPVTLANPFTGMKHWSRNDLFGGQWISQHYILSRLRSQKEDRIETRWIVLDAKTGKATDIRVPQEFDDADAAPWVGEPYVIFAHDGWLHCYRFNRR